MVRNPAAKRASDMFDNTSDDTDINVALNVRNFHHGQMDCTLSISLGDLQAGYIDFSEFDGIAHIQMIDVYPHCRRKGLGTRLIAELQARYPDQEIEWGATTPLGAKLRASLPTKQVPTQYAADFARLARLQARLRLMETEISTRHDQKRCNRAQLTAFYCLEPLTADLADRLHREKPALTIVDVATLNGRECEVSLQAA